jgi:hypothetical protein
MSLRDKILALDDKKRVPVEVPEWGLTVWVQSMSGADRESFDELIVKAPQQLWIRSVVLCACDEKGERLFADSDTDALKTRSAAALERIAKAALAVSGLQKTEDVAGN